jgi:hypothetical protein
MMQWVDALAREFMQWPGDTVHGLAVGPTDDPTLP